MVKINGKEQDASGKTIAELVSEGGYKTERVAVELNLDIVPKSKYTDTVVKDGDSVEIVGFVGGG
ncbi:MAG: sulfur carrier protein ThiS [Ruminococcus sp.]|nr:sulfur carrier protein ThiS [Ruminococcus sp.]